MFTKFMQDISEFLQGLKKINRCPNCEEPFFKNGEGGLVIKTEHYVEREKESEWEQEVGICVCCLSNSSSLNKAVIADGLKRRKWDAEDIELALLAVDEFLAGKIPYSTWREPRTKCS